MIGDLLRGDVHAQREARSILWQEVSDFILHRIRLPIGPLNEDEEARRDIALRVLVQLERHDAQALREWERRQRRGRDAASWWAFVKVLAKCRAIDFARCSRLNVASRKEGFRFARVEPVEPDVLAELMPSPLVSPARGSKAQLIAYLERVNASCAHRRPALDPEATPLSTPCSAVSRRRH